MHHRFESSANHFVNLIIAQKSIPGDPSHDQPSSNDAFYDTLSQLAESFGENFDREVAAASLKTIKDQFMSLNDLPKEGLSGWLGWERRVDQYHEGNA